MSEAIVWPPGWFRDPTGRHDHRWWDGAAWTAHVADAGIASTDPLPAAEPQGAVDLERPAPDRIEQASPGPTHGPATGTSDRVAVAALAVGLGSILVALIPGFGLVLPAVAIVLALVARSRIRTSGRAGDGLAVAGLVVSIGALILAIVVTAATAALLAGSGGELAGAFAEYVACLEVRSSSECRVLLEESLARITG